MIQLSKMNRICSFCVLLGKIFRNHLTDFGLIWKYFKGDREIIFEHIFGGKPKAFELFIYSFNGNFVFEYLYLNYPYFLAVFHEMWILHYIICIRLHTRKQNIRNVGRRFLRFSKFSSTISRIGNQFSQ